MKRLLPILLLVFSVGVGAYDQDDFKKLKATNECVRCDLSRVNLEGENLEGAKLIYANLGGANLVGANLERAHLNKVNLKRANLSNTNLQYVNLFKANLVEANLAGANLVGANLERARLDWANLKGANLSNTNLKRATLSDTKLLGANLTGANASGIRLWRATFCRTTMHDGAINNSDCESQIALQESPAVSQGDADDQNPPSSNMKYLYRGKYQFLCFDPQRRVVYLLKHWKLKCIDPNYPVSKTDFERIEGLSRNKHPVIIHASLTIRSNVRGDRVYIDGKYKGSTRLDLDLPKGHHTVRIEKEGYKTYEEEIDLTNALTLRASLEKISAQPVQTASTDNASVEVSFWESIRGSDDPDMYRVYLTEYPDGKFVRLAKLKIKKLGGSSVAKASVPNLDYGRYHALVIGNNNYRHLSGLKTAVNDARSVASVLTDDYGFEVQLLENATRSDVIRSLSRLRKTVGRDDNLLVYYAGHGYLDDDINKGYWLPVDADRDDPSNWIQNDTIVAQVKGMQAKHVMVVADSCFSGTITRGLKIEQRTPDWLQKIVKKKARTALTSGGLEPVMDSGGGNHSAFASAFISLLEENDGVLDASQLFSQLRPKVMVNSPQTPEYGNIHQAGHDGGDFLFVRQ